jgi:hypothetical protein
MLEIGDGCANREDQRYCAYTWNLTCDPYLFHILGTLGETTGEGEVLVIEAGE